MKIEDFDYHLPEELIAQKPAEQFQGAPGKALWHERKDWRQGGILADQADRGRYLGNYGQAGETVETRGQRDLFGEAFAAGGGEGLRKRWNPAGGISV